MNRKTQTMTERLAEFVTELTYEQIPEHVIETQKKSVLDAAGNYLRRAAAWKWLPGEDWSGGGVRGREDGRKP